MQQLLYLFNCYTNAEDIMGKSFSHLTTCQRVQMETMLDMGKSKAEVARYLGVHRSTITREYRKGVYTHRNHDYTECEKYSAYKAQETYEYNQTSKGKELKIGHDYELANTLEKMIVEEKYSPEAALAEIKNRGMEFSVTICVKTLYRYIDRGVFLNITNKDLPSKRNKKRKQKHVRVQKSASAGTSIEKRPAEIDTRMEFGNWEMDTVKGKRGKTKSCLLVLSERKTRMEIVRKMKNQKAESVVKELNKLNDMLGDSFSKIFKTITVDNGVEFANFEEMEYYKEKKRTNIYYCHAYSSYERGTNENINRMIRRHIPKGVDFDDTSNDVIHSIQNWINKYPRRMFNFRSSEELFYGEMIKNNIKCNIFNLL